MAENSHDELETESLDWTYLVTSRRKVRCYPIVDVVHMRVFMDLRVASDSCCDHPRRHSVAA